MSEIDVLFRLKAQVFANAARAAMREPPMKTIVVCLFIGLWVCGGFYLFYEGLLFVGGFPGIGDYLTGKLFYLFTLAVSLMLIFSSALLAYPVLYGRRENNLLFSLPISSSAIVACKLWETIFLSSWAFVLMAVPLILAYFLAAGMGVTMFFIAWLYFVPLAVLCGSSGMLISLLLGRYLPHCRSWGPLIVIGGLCVVAGIIGVRGWGGGGAADANQSLRFVNQIVRKCNFAGWFILPSRWVVDAVFDLGRGFYGRAIFLWLLLMSNAFFLIALCGYAGEKLLVNARDRRVSRASARGAVRAFSLLAARSPIRTIAAKDVITFFRDAGQWGQFALFFGLLGIYIVNLRNLPYELDNLFWRYLLFILNLSALGFTLAGLSSRFFFPLMSLELQRFWLLGPAPVTARQILREKYLLCVTFTAGITILLALLSGLMLRVSLPLLAASVIAVACMGAAISALSVGLGAVYPNLRARSSAEVISGLGGTMVLVLNLIFIFAALFIQGVPLYLHLRGFVSDALFPVYLIGGVCVLAAVSAVTASLSLGAGCRRLEAMDI